MSLKDLSSLKSDSFITVYSKRKTETLKENKPYLAKVGTWSEKYDQTHTDRIDIYNIVDQVRVSDTNDFNEKFQILGQPGGKKSNRSKSKKGKKSRKARKSRRKSNRRRGRR